MALPDPKLKLEPFNHTLRNLAIALFGEDNLFQNGTSNYIALNPITLFCTDSKQKKFFGDLVPGFDFEFCNKTQTVQTDVGLCISTNPTQYLLNEEIVSRPFEVKIAEDLRNVEHLMVISVDKLGKLDDVKVSYFSLILYLHQI